MPFHGPQITPVIQIVEWIPRSRTSWTGLFDYTLMTAFRDLLNVLVGMTVAPPSVK